LAPSNFFFEFEKKKELFFEENEKKGIYFV
jgi:hypothetical protein